MKTLFNNNWKFAKTPAGSGDNEWDWEYTPVHIPHDWLIYNTNNLYENSYGRYIKNYDFGNVSGKSIRLYFDGVYMNCSVFVNRRKAFDWKYGYSPFEADISDFLHDGENEIAVLVRHDAPNSRWYSGAGIFRNIWLIETTETYIVTDSVYFTAEKSGSNWNCTISAEFVNSNGCTAEISLDGNNLLYTAEIPADENFEHKFILENIGEENIWDTFSPNLLNLSVSLKKNNSLIDNSEYKVGLRTIEFTADEGFFINGRNVKINGVCLHHDLGCLGAAFNKAAAKRQLASMLEMGVNSVRTSHNMPAKEFMELCDEMGILVNSEAYDMWERPKTEFDNARFFDEWYEKDVASWIRRDRNHPSVIMWSVGNEIYDTHVSPRGREVAEMLHKAVRKHDYRCNVPTTIGSNYMPWDGAQNCAKEVDLAGYNYGEKLYSEHHEKYPHWKIYGSETTSGVKSRGVYHFPRDCAFMTHDDLQCSSLGNCRAGASAETAQKIIAINRDTDYCAGMYIWTGSDYIGEPSPYSTKNAYFGSIDTAGLKKDSFYLYEAAWTDKTVLHIMPYWDFNEGQLIDVVAYTNLNEAELFVNGKSAGKKPAEEYTIAWQIPYEKGEIKVVGINSAGEEISAVEHSFGNSSKLVLASDKSEIKADGEDLFTVTVSTVDADGYEVKNARDRVRLTVTGGRLVGFDNGDSTDYDQYKSISRRLFSGKAVAYIAAPVSSGDVIVTAESEGLVPASVTVKAVPAEIRNGISVIENVTVDPYENEIPIRKIELVRNTGSVITPDCPISGITAKILPENATYNDICWSIVTNSGIETKIAELEIEGNSALVKPIGDGSFRLRCYSLNGRKQPEIISELEYTAEGFGQAQINPYEFVVGCLYTDSIKLMDEVREGGVNIKADSNVVGFGKTDFGKYGADAFTVNIINWHKDCPFGFRLWSGKPFERGSVKLGEFTYQANFIWQTYIPNSFKLAEKIRGEHDIYFEFDKTDLRIDFGGFVFEPKLKAYETINASDNDELHGDTFEIVGTTVEHIGNNVFLRFDDMDFAKGTSEIQITGRTHHDNDSIHVHFVTESGKEIAQIIEFPGSNDNITVATPIPDIREKCSVHFKFLPGCDFDFVNFRIIANK
ncbi:MAG: DUF4982 domain-containing protein [Oscillospiraceae bacterium]|nr:DUF4982 domain-containing protein [Oscillospiraceae bacterium]